MAWIQPALPGGQYAPPIPYPDGVAPPPGTVIVATGPVPPPPPGFPAFPGYQNGPGGMLPAPQPQPGFWPTGPQLPVPDVAGLAGAGAALAIAGPFAAASGVPLIVLILGVILAAFLMYLFIKPLIAAFVKGTTTSTSFFLLLMPLILIGGLVLLLAVGGGGGGQSWTLFVGLGVMALVFLPLFGLLLPNLSTLLTP